MATALVLKAAGKRRNGRWVRGSIPAIPDIGNSTWHNAMTQAGVVVDAEDHDLEKAVVNGDTYLHVAVELVKRQPTRAHSRRPTNETTPRLNKLAEHAQERLEKATGELEAGTEELEEQIETLEEVLGGVAADIAPSDRRYGAGQDRPRRGDDLNPVQRKERGAARRSIEEEGLAEIAPFGASLDMIDAELHADRPCQPSPAKPARLSSPISSVSPRRSTGRSACSAV